MNGAAGATVPAGGQYSGRTGEDTGRCVERVATGLLGAVSGGVLGLIVSGFLSSLLHRQGDTPIILTGALSVLLAIGMAVLNLRQKPTVLPIAPRIAWGMLLSAAAMLVALAVFLFQGAYVQGVAGKAGDVHLPLAIWPISRAALFASLVLVSAGVLAALSGLGQVSGKRGRYSGGKWVAMSLLVGAAWAGLAVACYVTACGISFLR